MTSAVSRLCAAVLTTAISFTSFAADAPAKAAGKSVRILHVMSFDSPYRWTDGQLAGFKDGLGKDVAADYKIVQMDIKRNSTPEAKEKKAAEAIAIIKAWKPDLVYTTDDDAQQYLTAKYTNLPLPFVFSGMNKTPAAHGFEGASNITGVLEEEHFVESVRLLQGIAPKARRLVVISDEGGQWAPVIARIRNRMAQLPGSTLVGVDIVRSFEDYKAKMLAYPQTADAVVQLGVFNLKDAAGKDVPYAQIHRWVAENSKLPEISFWADRIHHGVLAGVTVSEREQGLAAGRLARRILVNGDKPSSLPIQPTLKGTPNISLARAKTLGLQVKTSLLLSAEVVTVHEWDKPAK